MSTNNQAETTTKCRCGAAKKDGEQCNGTCNKDSDVCPSERAKRFSHEIETFPDNSEWEMSSAYDFKFLVEVKKEMEEMRPDFYFKIINCALVPNVLFSLKGYCHKPQ
jgi:hypothetical protein